MIREPRKHVAAMFGVSQDYAYQARAVVAYSEALADRSAPSTAPASCLKEIPPAHGANQNIGAGTDTKVRTNGPVSMLYGEFPLRR